jgi:hypothetical protein
VSGPHFGASNVESLTKRRDKRFAVAFAMVFSWKQGGRRIISWELARGVRGNLTREEF